MAERNPSRAALWRHYLVTAVLALITLMFHARVDQKFSQMMIAMQEAAAIKKGQQIEELLLFDHYRQSTKLHLASRKHVREAYMNEHEAMEYVTRLRAEKLQADKLHKTAADFKEHAEAEEKEASDLDYASIGDNLDYVTEKLKGGQLARQAEIEASEAQNHLNHADELEQEGVKRLAEAEAQLNATGELSDVVENRQGACVWLSWACKGVERNKPADRTKTATDDAILIANAFDEALEILQNAKQEREHAMKLLHRSVDDTNSSIVLLEDSIRYKEKADAEHLHSQELAGQSEQAQEHSMADESLAELDDTQFQKDKQALLTSLETMSRDVAEARADARNATELDWKISQERNLIEESELRIRSIIFAAKQNISHAGWYALVSVTLATWLLFLVVARIVGIFRTEAPLRLLVRLQPHSLRDVTYICVHILILVLTMAFSGQLLQVYDRHGVLGRLEITALFACIGAFFQVTVLHFIPNMVRLISVSSLSTSTLQTLLHENVGKSGVVVLGVFVFEILLIWVNIGGLLFSRIYQLNGLWLWFLVFLASLVHLSVIENYRQHWDADDSRLAGSEMTGFPETKDGESTEIRPLVLPSLASGDTPSSLGTVDLASSQSGSHTTHYGSTYYGADLSPQVTATFITSWASQLNRLKLLLDFLIASWCSWISRHDILIIFKLSPLSAGIVWGMVPLWVLGVVFLASISLTLFICYRKYQSQSFQKERDEVIRVEIDMPSTHLLQS